MIEECIIFDGVHYFLFFLDVSLMTIVSSGANKTAVREDITQASELSDASDSYFVGSQKASNDYFEARSGHLNRL